VIIPEIMIIEVILPEGMITGVTKLAQ